MTVNINLEENAMIKGRKVKLRVTASNQQNSATSTGVGLTATLTNGANLQNPTGTYTSASTKEWIFDVNTSAVNPSVTFIPSGNTTYVLIYKVECEIIEGY